MQTDSEKRDNETPVTALLEDKRAGQGQWRGTRLRGWQIWDHEGLLKLYVKVFVFHTEPDESLRA